MTMIRQMAVLLVTGVAACALLNAPQVQAASHAQVRAYAGTWMTHPKAVEADKAGRPIALQFRREFNLSKRPANFHVRVSADNRYILFVNGHRIAAGPSRGDLDHWNVERLDLTHYLHAGRNVIAAQVWNDAGFAPRAQISSRTGFYFDSKSLQNTREPSGHGWRVRVDPSRKVEAAMPQLISQVGGTYYVGGAPETHDGSLKSADWFSDQTTASDWVDAIDVEPGQTARWRLIDDAIPQMAYTSAPGGKVVRAKGIDAGGFPNRDLTIQPHSTVSLLLDAGQVASAYPELTVEGGQGAKITITYGEALYDIEKKRLPDRASVKGGQVLGLQDTFMPGGEAPQTFKTLWWRTWRFAEIRITTGDAPLHLIRFARHRTGYPYQAKAYFRSSDPALNRIWQIGWDTLRADAHETFMDTSYWEQMQYIGDTRIEALVADSVSGDPRLSEKAMHAFDASRSGKAQASGPLTKPSPALDGLPQAAWPSSQYQSIPPFALLWIGALHDFHMRRPASRLILDTIAGVRFSLDWFARYVDDDGLLNRVPGWIFLDWKPNLEGNVTGGPSRDDNRCVLSLMYLGALRQAIDLEALTGQADQRAIDAHRAQNMTRAIQAQCWAPEKGLYADDIGKHHFSQHANALAILYDVAPKSQQQAILNRIMLRNGGIAAPAGITEVSFYFAYYLARAMDHAGLAERYPELLQSWRRLLSQNFTTWPETPDPSRSDSHAWSAHPTADLLQLVAGIRPLAPGFARVGITPHLGSLTALEAAMAHPKGLIRVSYRKTGQSLKADITLPHGLSGQFEWKGQARALHPGLNRLNAKSVSDNQP